MREVIVLCGSYRGAKVQARLRCYEKMTTEEKDSCTVCAFDTPGANKVGGWVDGVYHLSGAVMTMIPQITPLVEVLSSGKMGPTADGQNVRPFLQGGRRAGLLRPDPCLLLITRYNRQPRPPLLHRSYTVKVCVMGPLITACHSSYGKLVPSLL